jgi:serine/threonine protein kinase
MYHLGSLNDFIENKKSKFTEKYVYDIPLAGFLMKKISWSINQMHMKGFVHNDIKPDNVLLDSDEDEPLFPVICDFGIVQILDSADVVKGMVVKKIKGATLQYASPEIISFFLKKTTVYNPTFKSDVYSVGILAVMVFTRHNPWPDSFNPKKVLEGERPSLSGINSDKLQDFILSCCHPSSGSRPTMEEVYHFFCNQY